MNFVNLLLNNQKNLQKKKKKIFSFEIENFCNNYFMLMFLVDFLTGNMYINDLVFYSSMIRFDKIKSITTKSNIDNIQRKIFISR